MSKLVRFLALPRQKARLAPYLYSTAGMIRHYILTSWRNISRHKFYSIILILGLAIGMASATLLGAYTWRELTVDNFHEKKDRLYLVGAAMKDGTEESVGGWTSPPAGPALHSYFPEIESFARMCTWFDEVVVTKDDKKFVETEIVAADSTIFNLFTIPFVAGNPKTALKNPRSVVITEKMAKKYFGDADPMGQYIDFDLFVGSCLVTGVVKDYPDNSHFDFEMMFSLNSLTTIGFDWTYWMNHTFVTYVLLNENSSVADIDAKMSGFIRQELNTFYAKKGKTYDDYHKKGDYYKLTLVPLKDVHLSTLLYDGQEGKRLMVYALGIIAATILLLVCINYINLATVLSFGRAKEAGIRKVAGSRSKLLFRQFIVESIIMAFIGLIICVGLIEVSLPLFNSLIGTPLGIDYNNPMIIGGLILFAVVIGTLSGIFPATTFASFSPIRALKGNISAHGSRSWLRNGLIIFQFTICIVMIASTMIVYKQLSFMTHKNLGFDKEQILIIRRPEGLKQNKTAFKTALLSQTGIKKVSYSETIPGRHFNGHGQHFVGTPDTETPTIFPLVADPDIFETLGLEMINGNDFSDLDPKLPKAVLNEAAVQQLNLKDPFSAKIDRGTLGSIEVPIIGVVKDFNFMSFMHQVQPLVILPLDVENDPQHRTSYVLVKVDGTDVKSTIAFIEKQWKQMAGNYPFEYSFMDDDFNHLFENEERMAKVYSLFSGISIFIACLGLLGLISYFASRRNKEIGIRKIVGASIPNIITLLSRDFVKLLVLSAAIGCSVAWYLAKEWINKFVYQTEVSWWIFALAGGLMLVITVLVVGWQLYRAASVNPVETLRYE
jgi:putative ABC transport system permease protein